MIEGAIVGAFLGLLVGVIVVIRWAAKRASAAAAPKIQQFKSTAVPKMKKMATTSAKKVSRMAKSEEEQVLQIEDEYFVAAFEELERGTQERGLWLKAMALAEGDDRKQEALYIRLRAEELHEEAGLEEDRIDDSEGEKADHSESDEENQAPTNAESNFLDSIGNEPPPIPYKIEKHPGHRPNTSFVPLIVLVAILLVLIIITVTSKSG